MCRSTRCQLFYYKNYIEILVKLKVSYGMSISTKTTSRFYAGYYFLVSNKRLHAR